MADTITLHFCEYDGVSLSGDIPPDGSWQMFFTRNEDAEVCRFKVDVVDHFFPLSRLIKIENVVAWISLDDFHKAINAHDAKRWENE